MIILGGMQNQLQQVKSPGSLGSILSNDDVIDELCGYEKYVGEGIFLEWLDFVGDLLFKDCLVPIEKKTAAPRNPTKNQRILGVLKLS